MSGRMVTWWHGNVALITALFLLFSIVNLVEYYHILDAPVPKELDMTATAEAIEKMRLIERYFFVTNFFKTFDKYLWPLLVVAFCLIPRGWRFFKGKTVKLEMYPIARLVLFQNIFALTLVIGRYVVISILNVSLRFPSFRDLALLIISRSLGVLVLVKIRQLAKHRFFTVWMMAVPLALVLVFFGAIAGIRHLLPRFVLSAELESQIGELLEKAQIPLKILVPIDSSIMNAGYIGFPGFEAIVLLKGIINNCSSAEILAVMAHEIGHRRHLDLLKLLVILILSGYLRVGLYRWILGKPSYFHSQGFPDFENDDDCRFILWLNLADYTVTAIMDILHGPLLHALLWTAEFAADTNAVQMGYGPQLIAYFVRLTTLEPIRGSYHWLYALFYNTHPTVTMRIRAINKTMLLGSS